MQKRDTKNFCNLLCTQPKTAIKVHRDEWEYADLCDKCKESFKAWWENGKQAESEDKE